MRRVFLTTYLLTTSETRRLSESAIELTFYLSRHELDVAYNSSKYAMIRVTVTINVFFSIFF